MLAISRFRVRHGLDQAVREAFENRPHLVEQAPGFQGMSVHTDLDDPSTFLLITRWSDAQSFRAWYASDAHARAHLGLPHGTRLDAHQAEMTCWDEIPESPRPSPSPEDPDWWAPLHRYVSSSDVIHVLTARIDGVVQRCNPAMTRLLGAPSESLTGALVWSYLTDVDAAQLRDRVAACTRPAGVGRAASAHELGEPVLLNFLSPLGTPHTLECRIFVHGQTFTVAGHVPFHHDLALRDQLSEINHEMLVLVREHARQNKELQAAKQALEETLSDLNTVYWHLRRVREVLPICLNCGKVEVEGAQWETLFSFMQDHFPFLSHGYCPECASTVHAAVEQAALVP
jgi:heme-degrading monooxygenase HmoA